ncbi:MAG TPA: hypothetical protein VN436_03690 [Holophaga sp.]|nr:hypothetical protein [Holophaga sp.]
MKKIIWNLGKVLQSLGNALQKASGYQSKRRRKGTGNPPGRPRKKRPEPGKPLPLEA